MAINFFKKNILYMEFLKNIHEDLKSQGDKNTIDYHNLYILQEYIYLTNNDIIKIMDKL